MATKEDWQIAEEEGFQWLQDQYGHETQFYYHGKSNSNVSDYTMITKSGQLKNIGAKCEKSQIAQFTVTDTSSGYKLSKNAKTIFCPEMQPLLDELNTNYEKYKNHGTAGIHIDVKEKDAIAYIRTFLKNHNEPVQLLLRKNKDPIIYDSEHPEKIFDIKAIIRKKKSGSGNPPKKDDDSIISALVTLGCTDIPYRDKNNHLLVQTDVDLHLMRFIHDKYTYEIKKEADLFNTYRISRLSNTCNSTVIFSLCAKEKIVQDPNDLKLFDDIRLS